jgi:hypothetical protein
MNSQGNRSLDRFATTRWSMVMQLGATATGTARSALSELARRYWYPVYVYIRHCGHPPAAATDLARRFLHHLMEDATRERGQSAHGHYRSYLLTRLYAFLAGNRELPAGGATENLDMPTDLEERYQQDHTGTMSPEQSYQRAFALQVLHRTLRRLRGEAGQTGRVDMYDALEPFLARDPAPGEYEVIAKKSGTRPLTLVVALKRLRQRFRELAAEELVDTVASAEDLVSEQDALLAVLSDVRS